MSSPLHKLVGTDRTTIPELLTARAEASPKRTFLRWDYSEWSYAQMLEETQRFAGWAQNMKGGSTEHESWRIASFLPNRPETIWAWFGSLASGATYVALNREHRGDILLDMLVRSRAETLVTDIQGAAVLPALEETPIRTLLVVDSDSAPPTPAGIRGACWSEVAASEPFVGPHARPNDRAVLLYTSGTTGRSKAVLTTHNQCCRGASWVCWSLEMQPGDVIHGWLPLFHTGGQVDVVLPLVIAGGTVALYPTFSRSKFWSQVNETQASIFIGFSNVVEILWALPAQPNEQACSLRAGIMGGIPPRLHRPFEDRFGVRLYDIYGMSEAEPLVLPPPGEMYPIGSCGKASPDFEVKIVDDDDLPMAPDKVGEIVFRPKVPDVMMIGYEDDDRAMVDSLRSLWFHTGDLGRIDEDGYVYFVDRKKHSIRRRGENISSWELESVVLKHPAVAECCAVGVPSPLGEDDVKLAIVPKDRSTIDPAELRKWCEGRMARFMLPRYIDVLTRLPKTSLGKLRKHELIEKTDTTWDVEDTDAPTSAGSAGSQIHADRRQR